MVTEETVNDAEFEVAVEHVLDPVTMQRYKFPFIELVTEDRRFIVQISPT
jgi:hypothetical protein